MPDIITAPVENKLNEVSMLAVQAKDDPTLMVDLWNAVQRLIGRWARRYAQKGSEQGTRFFDADDLIQSGYFALVKAVANYAPEKSYAFTSFLHFYIRKQFSATAGRGKNGDKKALELTAVSLDAPLADDAAATVGDTLIDHATEFEDVIIERMAIQQACSELLAEVDKLPTNQRDVLLMTTWQGMTYEQACIALNITFKRLRSLRAMAAQKVKNSDTGRRVGAALDLGDPCLNEKPRRNKVSFAGAVGLAALLSNRRFTDATNEAKEPDF